MKKCQKPQGEPRHRRDPSPWDGQTHSRPVCTPGIKPVFISIPTNRSLEEEEEEKRKVEVV